MCTKIIVRIIVDFQSVEIKKRPGDGRGKIVKIATSFKSLEGRPNGLHVVELYNKII